MARTTATAKKTTGASATAVALPEVEHQGTNRGEEAPAGEDTVRSLPQCFLCCYLIAFLVVFRV